MKQIYYTFLALFFCNFLSIAQSVHTINLTQKRSKIVFSDTIDLDFKEDSFLCKKVVEIDDLTILFNGNLYNGLGTRVKLNKTIYDTKLKIEGAKICYYGAKDEFLIIPNTKTVSFHYNSKKNRQNC